MNVLFYFGLVLQTSAGHPALGPQDPVSTGVGGHAGSTGEFRSEPACKAELSSKYVSTILKCNFVTVCLKSFVCFSSPGSGDVYEKLREKVSQWSRQVPLS